MSNHIFISYSRKNSDFAKNLKEKLEAADVEVWTDESRLIPGEDWRESIDQAIRNALALIVVMTPTAEASKYVTYEWAFAWGIGVKIIPILLEPTSLHPRLEALQYLDFTHRSTHPWNKLTNLISELSKTVKDVPSVILSAITMLDSGSKGDRDAAINTLVESNHPVAFGNLIRNLNNHPLETVRRTVAQVLGQIGDSAVPALIKALDDQRPAMRQGAAEALGRIGDTAAVPALMEALGDQRPVVRQGAAEALGQIGDVRETAAEALERIKGLRRSV